MSLIAELKRRNVFRVGVAYVVAAWLLVEVASVFLPALRLPEWTLTFLVFLVVVGFPIALIFAWAFELTPEGIKREAEVDRTESTTHVTGRKLDFVIIALLCVALAAVILHRTVGDGEQIPAGVGQKIVEAFSEVIVLNYPPAVRWRCPAVLPVRNVVGGIGEGH